MNGTDLSSAYAANAVIALDCAWCAEPIRATVDELVGGLACPACLVHVEFADEPNAATFATPIAA